jgi:hypothetical protein
MRVKAVGEAQATPTILPKRAGAVNHDLHAVAREECAARKCARRVLISLEAPTQAMRSEAASAGFYQAPWGKQYPRLQLLTVEELLAGKTVEFPRENVTFKKAPKARGEKTRSEKLPF